MYPWHDYLEVINSSMSPCSTQWQVGTWLMIFYDSVMSTKQNKRNIDGTLKRVHTDVSDSSSSDEESRKSSNSVKKSKVISSKNWSRFLISSIQDGALTKLSPFAIQKVMLAWLVRKLKQVCLLNVIQKSIQLAFLSQPFFVKCQLR